jgi:glycosyltransferase involved in cell wall biosynthesis
MLCNASAGRNDAIRDYTLCLARAVRQHGVAADVCLRSTGRDWLLHRDAEHRRFPADVDLREYDAVVLQYNPFMFGRWGFAPWLPWSLLQLKRSRQTRIGLMVHEPYVPMSKWQWVLMGAWQRMQLDAVRLSATVVFASIEAWATLLSMRWQPHQVVHLPVGSNLPDRRGARRHMRQRLQVRDDDVVLASLSTGTAGRLPDYIVHAANALADEVGGVVILHLGAGAVPFRGMAGSVRVYQPGRQPRRSLASLLSAGDVFLAPFIDGVSTRRSSVMAALQHGVPVVGTSGPLTDSVLRRATEALRLVPVDRPDLFTEAVLSSVRLPTETRCQARAARTLYDTHFAWPVIAERFLSALDIDVNRKVAQCPDLQS